MPLIVKCALISLLFLPLIIYLVVGFGGKGAGQAEKGRQPQAVKPDMDNMLTFCDKAGGYQIQYPSNWTLDDQSAANQMVRANIGQGDRVGFQIRVYDDMRQESDAFVDWYAEQFIEDMTGHWGGDMSQAGREHGLIGKEQGSRLTFVLNRRDGEKWFFKHYLWRQGRRVIVLQCGTPVELRQHNEPVLDKIAETFEFVPQEGAR
jgi:hypothetical protein